MSLRTALAGGGGLLALVVGIASFFAGDVADPVVNRAAAPAPLMSAIDICLDPAAAVTFVERDVSRYEARLVDGAKVYIVTWAGGAFVAVERFEGGRADQARAEPVTAESSIVKCLTEKGRR